MFRKVMLVFLALAFCALVVAGIDLARHAMAARRLENAGVRLRDWHYRFSGKTAPARYGYHDLQSWRGSWRRMIAIPRQASLFSRQPSVRQMVVDRKVLRDLALLEVEEIEMFDCRGLMPEVMSELSRNASLRVLLVARCDVTNEGVNLLWSGCPHLKQVQFMRKDIGDDAFRNVKAASALRRLNLSGVAITNQTIVYLREAPRLEKLVLADVRIGEDCGPLLAAMPRLRRVDLGDVKAAAAIRERLRVLRPDITWICERAGMEGGVVEW
jgi:hypothetical protein